ncbi:MAG: trypsin-like peptidase domain-containing protein [Alicyclobacillus sp.]|nr:trypsin-like peptidase domain-containing protein [Alicyclobacillus sp.]
MYENGWRRYAPFILVAVISSFVTSAVFFTFERLSPEKTAALQPAPAVQPSSQIAPGTDVFIAARQRVEPAVVYLDVQSIRQGPSLPDENLFPFLSPFREFFGPQIRQGTGSGFIYRADGYILTNAHVVEGAQRLRVTLADKRRFEGRVIGVDRELDLAVVKIEAKGLPTVTMGDSDRLQVGQWVLAIGNPLGYHHTVTAGIVSALNRSLEDPDRNGYLIQTDAAINPGNSGGPLINLQGEVVGINEAILAEAQGMGFAIPVNMAKQRLEALTKGQGQTKPKEGQTGRPWLGITMGDLGQLPNEIRMEYNIFQREGVFVAEVASNSPAEKAGFQRFDVIVSIDRRSVKTMEEVRQRVQAAKVGQTLSVVVSRRGRYHLLRPRLEPMPLEYQD